MTDPIGPAATGVEIRPFPIAVPQADLDDLNDRLRRTHWPDQLPGVGRTTVSRSTT